MSNKVIQNQILEIIRQPRKSGGPRIVYKCKCLTCDRIVKIRKAESHKYTGKCMRCSHIKRPFESLFMSLKNDWRKLKNELTYETFLEFTKQKNCHYCLANINWQEYSIVDGKYITRAVYLDRKDNDIGYIIDNLAVCCTKCNRAKSNKYTYEEWYGMTEYFRKMKSV